MATSQNVVLPQTEYEVIDIDPHFTKVVRYMRGSDLVKIGLFTLSGPLFMSATTYFSTRGRDFHVSARYLRLTSLLGFTAGFLDRYSVGVQRFQGGLENAREVRKDRYEIKSLLAQGKSPYYLEKSELPEWLRKVAAKNSTNSVNGLALIPWFNFVHHEFHGVSLDKYYETRPGEEEWGFDLTKPSSE
jgi:hypothetical protein